jgi:hypothetical protein
MTALQYLLDENLGQRLRKAMRAAAPQITVWCVGDAGTPLLGAKDPEILVWCELYNFILVTDNRRSMPAHLQDHLGAGGHIPGIFVLRPDWGIGETIDELVLIWEASLPGEYRDQMRYLPISG